MNPNIILTLVSALSFIGILGVFIFFEKRNFSSVYLAFILIPISILSQLLFFVEPISKLTTIKSLDQIEYWYFTLSFISSMFIVYLLSIWNNLSENQKAISFILGAFQIAIFMSVASLSNISVYLKILLNIYCLCIPAVAIHKLTLKGGHEKMTPEKSNR
ncbi:hypothetical protein, partial [Rodentibacter pneumotropicus]